MWQPPGPPPSEHFFTPPPIGPPSAVASSLRHFPPPNRAPPPTPIPPGHPPPGGLQGAGGTGSVFSQPLTLTPPGIPPRAGLQGLAGTPAVFCQPPPTAIGPPYNSSGVLSLPPFPPANLTLPPTLIQPPAELSGSAGTSEVFGQAPAPLPDLRFTQPPPGALGLTPGVTHRPPPPALVSGPPPARRPPDLSLTESSADVDSVAPQHAEDAPSGAEELNVQKWLTDWSQQHNIEVRMKARAKKKKQASKLVAGRCADLSQLSAPSADAVLARQIRLRRQRRAADRRRRRARRDWLARRHAEIDGWRRRLQEQHLRQTQLVQVKREADNVLGEVRRKISDVEQRLQVLEELRTLREVRDMKARNAGRLTTAAADQRFSDVTQRLSQLLDGQLMTYEAELRTLSVMTGVTSSGGTVTSSGGESTAGRVEAALRLLFGADGATSVTDSDVTAGRPPTTEQLHNLHMKDWESRPKKLISIRAEWDKCVVPDTDPLGSAVPPVWVSPAPPSSDLWASCLLTTDQSGQSSASSLGSLV